MDAVAAGQLLPERRRRGIRDGYGVVFNRVNVALLGMTLSGEETYFPSTLEFLVTLSMIASMVFFFSVAVKLFPVFSRHEEPAGAVTGAGGSH